MAALDVSSRRARIPASTLAMAVTSSPSTAGSRRFERHPQNGPASHLLALAGDVPTTMGGIDYLPAAHHVQSFRDACVYAASINSADSAPAQIHEAIATEYTERGVALLNISQDVLEASTARPPLSLAIL